MTQTSADTLLAIIELGGYPNFTQLYKRLGYEVVMLNSVRKALGTLKKTEPKVIVAEFNFQSDFRDRTSSLESLLAVVERKTDTKVIVFYDKEQRHQLEKLLAQFNIFEAIPFPIESEVLEDVLQRAN